MNATEVARSVLKRLLRGESLYPDEAEELLSALTDPRLEPALAGAVLAALRAKGESSGEVRGFATGMRDLADRVTLPEGAPAVDVVGTGGDGSGSLNLSTGSALLAAACGLRVVKHGNRSISSRSGSADVLEKLGYVLPADGTEALASLARTGFTYLFAPHFHPAMKSLAPVRQALAIRTIFNVLGPLTNPASPPFSVIGAYSADVARLMADALSGLPIDRAFVVHGAEGWDEPTPIGPFLLFDVRPGSVTETHRYPGDYALDVCRAEDLQGGDSTYNAGEIRSVFAGEEGPHLDALLLGAGLALEVTGLVTSMDEAVEVARGRVHDGSAARLLASLDEAE